MRNYLAFLIILFTFGLISCNSSKTDTGVINNFYNFANPFDSSSSHTTFRALLDVSDIGKYNWTLEIYTENGTPVYVTSASVTAPSSPLDIIWNGRDNSGKIVQNGVYKAILKINVTENGSGAHSGASYQASCNPVIY